jgi:uncharacterized membrane protein
MADSSQPDPYVPPTAPPMIALPVQWSPTEALEFGWRTMMREPKSIAVVLVALLSAYVVLIAAMIPFAILNAQHDRELATLAWVIYVLAYVITLPLSLWVHMGLIRYSLKLARGQPASFGDVYSGGPFLSFLGAALLASLGAMVGMLFCVVPGYILLIGWLFYGHLIVDRRLPVIEALSASWRITNGHKWKLLLFMLLMAAVALLGELACCVGVFVAIPVVLVAYSYVYLRLIGEVPPMPAS